MNPPATVFFSSVFFYFLFIVCDFVLCDVPKLEVAVRSAREDDELRAGGTAAAKEKNPRKEKEEAARTTDGISGVARAVKPRATGGSRNKRSCRRSCCKPSLASP